MQGLAPLVYDLEIVRAIPPRPPGKQIAGIEYCKGWDDHENMGISVLCAYDYATDRFRVFTAENLLEFEELAANRIPLVGFNNIRFDNKVIRANGIKIADMASYDLLREMWNAARLDPDKFSPSHGGFSLDKTAEVNLGHKKTGSGELAPVLWQENRIGEVIDYCLEDVRLTRNLFDRILDQGYLRNPKNPDTVLTMRNPHPTLGGS